MLTDSEVLYGLPPDDFACQSLPQFSPIVFIIIYSLDHHRLLLNSVDYPFISEPKETLLCAGIQQGNR
jgi:hypothetical protein